MKNDDLKNKSKEELLKMRDDLKARLTKLSFDLAGNKLKDVSQIKKAKRSIAKILTVLNTEK